jgi:hypothetical protein
MNPSLTRGRILTACGVLILFLALLLAPPAVAERPSDSGQLLLWLLSLGMGQLQGNQKIDINSATAEQLRAVPGIERRQALRIVTQRPYAKLQELVRAGLSPRTIERLARFLTVDADSPSALPSPTSAPRERR